VPTYKVKFTDPTTGKGFIDGYRTARAARAAVDGINGHRLNTDGKVMLAEYLGREPEYRDRIADRIDGYDRDDLGLSLDY
jgi:hypothetical protein